MLPFASRAISRATSPSSGILNPCLSATWCITFTIYRIHERANVSQIQDAQNERNNGTHAPSLLWALRRARADTDS